MNLVGRRLTRSALSHCLTAAGLLLVNALCGHHASAQSRTTGGTTRTASVAAAHFTLQIDGAIRTPDGARFIQLDSAAIRARPQQTVTTHTPWHDGTMTFSGPRLWDLLEPLKPTGKSLHITALNDYSVDIPLSDLQRYQPVLAWQLNGKALSVRDKGPLFLIYPFDAHPELHNQLYYGRSIWQIKRITIE
ncbi:molybdopterin-dependent oxidoreductase [Malikia spinosa]|jgi:hypothetical protein|uniref:Molybdopterin-dependent oxidoreductase n=1 Tax=Malikia spinosa TaxID=86180 RepID=A0A7C9J871_9BURK|nr:molybdopterin-dependent oxidoreductase [Malikia spinosa]MYZ53531.1 molybdopterin-dependent oxidoreductase [Malikia spinosa]